MVVTRPTEDERLGALLDRRLGEPERAELLARVAASEDDVLVLAEAAAVLREIEEETAGADPGGADVVPLRPPDRPGLPRGGWLALAALLAGVTLTTLLWPRPDEAPAPRQAVALLSDRGAGFPAEWDDNPWSSTRGLGDPLRREALAARIGARLVDLEVAVRADDAGRKGDFAAELAALLDEVPAAGDSGDLARSVGARRGEEALALLEQVQQAAVVAGAEDVARGAWAEAARLAAARGDAVFFRAAATRRLLARAAGDGSLQSAAREAAARILGVLDADDPPDWEALRLECGAFVGALGT
jgi:hypothetical protein